MKALQGGIGDIQAADGQVVGSYTQTNPYESLTQPKDMNQVIRESTLRTKPQAYYSKFQLWRHSRNAPQSPSNPALGSPYAGINTGPNNGPAAPLDFPLNNQAPAPGPMPLQGGLGRDVSKSGTIYDYVKGTPVNVPWQGRDKEQFTDASITDPASQMYVQNNAAWRLAGATPDYLAVNGKHAIIAGNPNWGPSPDAASPIPLAPSPMPIPTTPQAPAPVSPLSLSPIALGSQTFPGDPQSLMATAGVLNPFEDGPSASGPSAGAPVPVPSLDDLQQRYGYPQALNDPNAAGKAQQAYNDAVKSHDAAGAALARYEQQHGGPGGDLVGGVFAPLLALGIKGNGHQAQGYRDQLMQWGHGLQEQSRQDAHTALQAQFQKANEDLAYAQHMAAMNPNSPAAQAALANAQTARINSFSQLQQAASLANSRDAKGDLENRRADQKDTELGLRGKEIDNKYTLGQARIKQAYDIAAATNDIQRMNAITNAKNQDALQQHYEQSGKMEIARLNQQIQAALQTQNQAKIKNLLEQKKLLLDSYKLNKDGSASYDPQLYDQLGIQKPDVMQKELEQESNNTGMLEGLLGMFGGGKKAPAQAPAAAPKPTQNPKSPMAVGAPKMDARSRLLALHAQFGNDKERIRAIMRQEGYFN